MHSRCAPLVLALAAACTKVDSDNILTSGMYADILARTDERPGTTVTATLFLGNPENLNFVELTGDDALIAQFGAQSKVMTETELLGIVVHSADFANDAGGDEFVVDFERSVDGGAPRSVATIPTPFEIVPLATSLSRAAGFDVTWDPISSDRMKWQVAANCLEPASGEIPVDDGTVRIAAGELRKSAAQNTPDTCQATLTITRGRNGMLDRGYGHGGVVRGEQVRSLVFTTTP